MADSSSRRLLGAGALVLAITLWGISFAVNRWLLAATALSGESWPGLSLSMFRFAVAAPVLLPWAVWILHRRRHGLTAADRWQLPALGVLGVVGYHLLAATAQQLAPASLNAVLHQMTPLVAFAGGLVLLREKLSVLKALGLLVASAGAVWYSIIESGATLTGRTARMGDNIPLAAFLIFLVAIDWTLFMVVAKKVLRRWSGIETAVLGNAIGAVMLIAVAELLRAFGLGVSWRLMAGFSPWAWANIVFLAMVAGIVCYVLYNAGLKRLEASRVAVFGYLLVPGAMLAALQLPGELKEELSLWKVACAAVIILGVLLVTWKPSGNGDRSPPTRTHDNEPAR